LDWPTDCNYFSNYFVRLFPLHIVSSSFYLAMNRSIS
jgi:hypothetical protein